MEPQERIKNVNVGISISSRPQTKFKMAYEFIKNDGIDIKDNEFQLQLAIGF